MLVLAHTDGLGVDLHQLGQRILQSPRNAGRATQADVHVGHFLRSKFTGRIHRGTRLADHHFVNRPGGAGSFCVLGDEFDQVGSKFVGLAAGGAVANRNQVDAMLFTEFGQRVQRAIPVFAGLVRKHRGRLDQFARGIDHGHFDARANARVQAHHHARAGGRGQQQVAQVVGKHLDGYLLGLFAQAREQVALQRQAELDAPGPGHAFAQQVVSGPRLVAPAQVNRDLAFSQRHHGALDRTGGDFRRLRQDQLGVQNLQRAPAKHRQRTVRRHAADRLVVVKVVAKLGMVRVVLVLACHQLGAQQAFAPQPGAQRLHQRRVFSPALAQDVAHAVQHGLHGAEVVTAFVFFGHHVGRGSVCRHQGRVGKQGVGQRLDAVFTRYLALGTAPGLVGQVQVFEVLLGGGRVNGGTQLGRELALLFNAFEHGVAAVFELAQVAQAVFKFTQLNVVQPAGDFFAVTGNKWNCGAAIEQLHCGADLLLIDFDFCGDLPDDFLHERRWTGSQAAANRAGKGIRESMV